MNYFAMPGLRNQVYPIIGDIMQPITMAQTNQNEKVIRILNKVCYEFGITFEEIKRKSRFHKYRAPRQVAMYLLR
jgi:chromosomal replication initiation ATPase DnaA